MSSATTAREPAGYVVWHRENRPRARWKKVSQARDHAAAVALVDAAGDWWLAPIRDPQLLACASVGGTPSLFSDTDDGGLE